MENGVKSVKAKEIVKSIKNGLKDVKNSNSHPINELWDKLIISTDDKDLRKSLHKNLYAQCNI